MSSKIAVKTAAALFLLLLWGGVGCTRTPQVVKIGLVAPFEGQHRTIGYDAIYAARLAVREANTAGRLHGVRVNLVALDDGGRPDLAAGTARSLVLDDDTVAVVGHGRMETTAVAQPIYAAAQLSFLPLGREPFAPIPPAQLDADFVARYEAVTPFDETADRWAGPTYAAVEQVLAAIEAAAAEGPVTRETVKTYLEQ